MVIKKLIVEVIIRGTCKKCGSELARVEDIDIWLEGLGDNEDSDIFSERLLLEGHMCLPGEGQP